MLHSLSILLALAAFTALRTHAQSSTPNCYACPPEDQLGFAIGVKDETTDPIFCSYPAVVGEDPNDFFCTYSRVCLFISHQRDPLLNNLPLSRRPESSSPIMMQASVSPTL